MLPPCRQGYWPPHEVASSIFMRIATSRNERLCSSDEVSQDREYQLQILARPTQHIIEMDINMHQARKSGSPPSTSSSYLNIAAFDSMAYPVAEDVYTDYYEGGMMGGNNQGYSDMGNVRPLDRQQLVDLCTFVCSDTSIRDKRTTMKIRMKPTTRRFRNSRSTNATFSSNTNQRSPRQLTPPALIQLR